MINQEIDPRTVSRIQKLLALANDGGATEAEAELAMAKAQELMAEHNLTIAALEAAGGQGEKRSRLQHEKKLMFVWKRELLQAIAAVNFCHVILKYSNTRSNESNVTGYDLIGRESNIVAVRNMFHYLLETIERLVIDQVGTSAQQRGSRYAHSFRLGASDKLKDRLSERHQRKLREQEREANEQRAANRHPGAATGNALVVVLRDFAEQEDDLNNDLRREWEPGTTAKMRAEDEATYAEQRRKLKDKIAKILSDDPTISEELARYLAQGWSRERAEEILRPGKPETETQRRKRMEKEERSNRRYWERAERRADREASKIDRNAFRAGSSAADNIGLDEQVNKPNLRRVK